MSSINIVKAVLVCYYCGIKEKTVEAEGIRYCPNPWCCGPGAIWFRSKLESYREEGGQHTVNAAEYLEAARMYLCLPPRADLLVKVKASKRNPFGASSDDRQNHAGQDPRC